MRYIEKDITTVQAPAIIAHGVNCQNAMGSGVARAIYMKWPVVKAEYHAVFRSKHPMFHVSVGDVQFVEVEPTLVVANCFTQNKYGRDGKRYANPEALEKALWQVQDHATFVLGIKKIHIPRIGAGLGGLDWEDDVEPILHNIENLAPVTFVVCDG